MTGVIAGMTMGVAGVTMVIAGMTVVTHASGRMGLDEVEHSEGGVGLVGV